MLRSACSMLGHICGSGRNCESALQLLLETLVFPHRRDSVLGPRSPKWSRLTELVGSLGTAEGHNNLLAWLAIVVGRQNSQDSDALDLDVGVEGERLDRHASGQDMSVLVRCVKSSMSNMDVDVCQICGSDPIRRFGCTDEAIPIEVLQKGYKGDHD